MRYYKRASFQINLKLLRRMNLSVRAEQDVEVVVADVVHENRPHRVLGHCLHVAEHLSCRYVPLLLPISRLLHNFEFSQHIDVAFHIWIPYAVQLLECCSTW